MVGAPAEDSPPLAGFRAGVTTDAQPLWLAQPAGTFAGKQSASTGEREMTERKIALVTGGAQGIGLACAEALAADGFQLVLADINETGVQQAAKTLGRGTLGLTCDMADPTAIAALFDRIEAEAGPVSALVNNAGIAMPGDFLSYDLDTFNKVIAVNMTSVFIATQRAARTMIKHDIAGAIVNMSSINAQLAIPAIPAYCASKGGVMQLTKVAALALAKNNIRVNAVGPGSIDTAMMAGVNANPEVFKTAMSRTPMGRPGTAREIGDVVAFLASSKASYITGETIYVDGGRLGLNYTM
jgi:NAD(P)-dependent dehydrogenase (short-subunit alcohol dehydrogenase family)